MQRPEDAASRIDRRDLLKSAAVAGLAAGLASDVANPLASIPSHSSSASASEGTAEPWIECYPERLSYQPGDEVALCVSTSAARYSVEVARVGAAREVVLRQEGLEGARHATPENAATHGCGWPAAWKFTVDAGWRSGYYSVVLSCADEQSRTAVADAFFVVRAAQPGRENRILLQLGTNTYNAYNNWGGSCLYESGPQPMAGARVSFERPMARGFLSKPEGTLSHWAPYAGWHNWERSFVAWAEAAGYQLDYAINSDMELRPEILAPYRLVLSVGHDEYWSAPMRDHLEQYIANGGNVAFFSGNVCYWQVRTEDEGRGMVCYKYKYRDDPLFARGEHKLLTTLWSHSLIGRPENTLTGVSFNYGGYHQFGSVPHGAGGYTVHRPEHWVFAGTELAWGDALGSQHKIVGYECDGCLFTLDNGLPVPTHGDGTPDNFEILASAPARLWETDLPFRGECLFGDKTNRQFVHGAAVMGTYTRGGTVFTTGCTEWSKGLAGGDPLVDRITRNVLDRLSATA